MPRTHHPDTLPDQTTTLVITGEVARAEAHADGTWTITPATGRPIRLATEAAVEHPAPAPAAPAAGAVEDDNGCGCAPAAAPAAMPKARALALQQARAVTAALAELGVPAARRSATYDEQARRPVVRIVTAHGLYALHIPPVGQVYPVHRNGRRNGTLGDTHRTPAVSDSHVAALLLAYLRDRGELEWTEQD